MKCFVRRLDALILGLLLLTGTALAGPLGLDDSLSAYFDLNQDTSLEMTLELKNLPPFDESAVGMFNGALKHISVSARMNGEDTVLRFLADGAEVFSLGERVKDGVHELTTSLLPNRVLTSGQDALETLFPTDGEGEGEEAFRLSQAVTQAEACYQALTDLISPFAEEKKANYKIADIGHAKWVRLARLTQEQSAGLLPQLIELLGCGTDAAFREQIQGLACKKGFTIALYQTKEGGEDMAVYIKGNVTLGEDDSRALTYQWAFLREEGKRKDTYKLELERSKRPVERRLIEASSSQTETDGQITVAEETSITLKTGADTTLTTRKSKLKGEKEDGRVTLAGTLSTQVKTTADGDTQTVTTELTPNLTMTSAQGAGVLSGSVGYTETTGKTPGLSLVIALAEEPAQVLPDMAADGQPYTVAEEPEDEGEGVTITIGGSSLTQNLDAVAELTGEEPAEYLVGQVPQGLTDYPVPASPTTVSLDGGDQESLDKLRGEMYQNAAGRLLKALISLEGEDGALFRDNMTDGDFASLLSLLGELE